MKIRVSIIGYRDFEGSNKLETSVFSILSFTDDEKKPLKHLKKLEPEGGYDGPEDICGAFNVALNQDWQSKHRYAVLITDAPCHG